MGFKEIIEKMREKKELKKDLFKRAEAQMQVEKLLEERNKSSNLRELERYQKEDREKEIKETLEYHRKKRQNDIQFNHNPINAENVTNHTDWHVLKNKNLFSNNKCNL